ncbi:hypothetical protein EJ08DRAFT_40197 [Tothia fuscella]|uniref:Uncharacterized protein n=1 Tax=Tothia fuscella TaxID=1048955 RepID=A0A9P4U0P5_9PEZI|nr:hypothetical protein EJ08DRAFT_40197 [Tothia fuscella]
MPFQLLKLPRELRDTIYRQTFEGDFKPTNPCSILGVSKQVHREAKKILLETKVTLKVDLANFNPSHFLLNLQFLFLARNANTIEIHSIKIKDIELIGRFLKSRSDLKVLELHFDGKDVFQAYQAHFQHAVPGSTEGTGIIDALSGIRVSEGAAVYIWDDGVDLADPLHCSNLKEQLVGMNLEQINNLMYRIEMSIEFRNVMLEMMTGRAEEM